jgi:RHS repeat-associated protein
VRGTPDVTTFYINKYYEKTVATATNITTSYYLGGKMVATSKNSVLSYILQDHLGSTAATANSGGALTSTINYYSFGSSHITWGTLPTDKKFTGQRLDSTAVDTTGLYYYNARYYDAALGRFISPDTIVPNPAYPQSLNRYSYCLNNPLKYIDPSGHESLEDYLNTLKNNGVDIDPEKEAREFEESHGDGGDGGGGGGGSSGWDSRPSEPSLPASNPLINAWRYIENNWGRRYDGLTYIGGGEFLYTGGGEYGITDSGELVYIGVTGSVTLGSSISIDPHVLGEMGNRGWTEPTIRSTIDNPYATSSAIGKTSGNPATAFWRSASPGDYVVVDNVTLKAFAIGKATNPRWTTDSVIGPRIVGRTGLVNHAVDVPIRIPFRFPFRFLR